MATSAPESAPTPTLEAWVVQADPLLGLMSSIDVLGFRLWHDNEAVPGGVTASGAAVGAGVGAVLGPVGAVIGGLVGASQARSSHPDGHIEYELAISIGGVTLTRATRWSAVETLVREMKQHPNREVARLADSLPTKKLYVHFDSQNVQEDERL